MPINKIAIYHNESATHFNGYQNGDALVKVAEHTAEDAGYGPAEDPQPDRVADRMFNLHNRDMRPRRTEIRSLSVGDVVRINDLWLACEKSGWIDV